MDTSKIVGTSMMFASLAYVFFALRYCDSVYAKVLAAYPELTPDPTTISARLGWSSNIGVVSMITNRDFLPSSASDDIKKLVDKAQLVYFCGAFAFVAFVIGMLIA